MSFNGGATVERRHIDPAALLIAVLTVVVAPLTTTGLWDKLNTVVAVVVLVIVMSFTLIGQRRQELQSPYEKLAVSLVIGLIFAVAVAYPVQELIVKHFWRIGHPVSTKMDEITISNRATWVALGFGLLAMFMLFGWLLLQSSKDRAQDEVTAENAADVNGRLKELKAENERLRGECDQLKQSVAFWVREATTKGQPTPHLVRRLLGYGRTSGSD